MAFVQAVSTSSANASGTAGASVTGVAQGHGLVCFVLYNVAATNQTLTDSSGTTWTLWRTTALTGAAISVFRTTSLVVAGTHTITPSWTGGGGAWSSLIEDDQSPYGGGVYAPKYTAPGAGNTLLSGGILGSTGSSCYQLAVDTTHTSGTTFCPAIGAFNTNIWAANDAGIGSWTLAPSTTVGGTNSGMAPGSSDSTGADTYAVLAMAFQPAGTYAIDATPQVVLVEEDFQRRAPHDLGLLFNRNPAFTPVTPLAFLSTKTPPWEHYRDTFTSVYPLLQAFGQNTQITPAGPLVVFYTPTKRLDPPEEDLRRFDHQAYFQVVKHYVGQMVGYTVEVQDLNADPWLEWVHPPASPEAALFAFRRQVVPAKPYQFPIMWGQPKPWWVDEEKDTVLRNPPNLELLIPFPRPAPPAVFMPNLIGLDLATAIGILQSLNLLFLQAVYQDVIYPIPAPNRFNPIGPEPPPPYGTVIGQWPLPGAVVEPILTEVTLYVSTGRSFISDVDTSSGNIPNTVIGSTQGP